MTLPTIEQLKTNKSRLRSLQMFRGFAALLVLLYHATTVSTRIYHQEFLGSFFKFGNSGVIFFFVLSGFIIYYVHADDLGKPRKFKSFIIKRFIRLYPIYWIVSLTVLPVYFIFPSFGESFHRRLDVILQSLILYPQNPQLSVPIIAAAWTLSYEVFFYLIFSCLILLKPKISLRIVVVWVLGIIVGNYYAIAHSLETPNFIIFYFLLSPINLNFIFGCLAAYLVLRLRDDRIKISYILLLIIIGVGLYIRGNYNIGSTIIIFSFALLEDLRAIAIYPLLCYLGDASYSIYLTHGNIVAVLARFTLALKINSLLGTSLTMLVIVAITIVCGCGFYSYIEKPLLVFLRKKMATRAQ